MAPVQSQISSQLWYATVTNCVFDGLEELRFDINVTNAMEQGIILGEVDKEYKVILWNDFN